jgi:hypothetical protein
MDSKKSNEYNFIFLMNKCILLYNYIDTYYQKDILNDIKSFINKLTDVVSLKKFHSFEDKKNNILIILNKYLNKIIEDKIFHLFEENNTEDIFYDIEKKAIKITTEKMKQNEIENKYILDKKINEQIKKSETIIKDGIKDTIIMDNNQINELKEIHKTHLINFEKKVDNKIKIIFNEIENNIKLSLKDYIEHTIKVENELDNKVEIKMQSYKKMIENKMKDFIDNLFENTELNNKINNKVNIEINEIYKYVENIFLNLSNNVDNKIVESLNNQIDIKVRLLTNLFNTQFEDVINVISSKVNNNNTDIYSFLQDKVNDIEYNLNQNKYSLLFDKNDNIIRLMNGNEEISNTKINIKGLIGPKGPAGNQGEKGESPIIRKIGFTNDKKIKFIIQDSENIYEILSETEMPIGPQGIQGERGLPGKTFLELNWNQNHVMRIDENTNNSLIIMKSLSIGENGHCLKENSISVGNSVCYNNNSFAIGNNSKTLDNNSMALFGTTIGKNAFSYRADNVDENNVVWGKSEMGDYNIQNYFISSKEINLDCDTLNIKGNKLNISKIKELEDRLISLEKKYNELIKKK